METNGSKNWWNLVKSLLHSDSGGDRSILQVENDMIQDDKKKICVFTVTQPTLIFASNPMNFYTECG
jgi:hypothetical protein